MSCPICLYLVIWLQTISSRSLVLFIKGMLVTLDTFLVLLLEEEAGALVDLTVWDT